MRKLTSVLLSTAFLLSLFSISAFAAQTPVISYHGGSTLTYTDASGKPLSGNSDFGTAFSKMLPGVTYTQNILLKNEDNTNTVRYYMDLSVLETLKASALDGAGYTITLVSGKEMLYSSQNGNQSGILIGGSGSAELLDLNHDLVSNNGDGILVATLAPGKSETVSLSILAEETMSDAYQNAKGTLSFQFFGEIVPPQVPKIIYETVYIDEGVKTGDSRPVFFVAGVLVIAVIVFFLLSRKKDKESA